MKPQQTLARLSQSSVDTGLPFVKVQLKIFPNKPLTLNTGILCRTDHYNHPAATRQTPRKQPKSALAKRGNTVRILISTPVGRTESGQQIDYFPSRWSGSSGEYKVTSFYPFSLAYLSSCLKTRTDHHVKMVDANYYGVDEDEYVDIVTTVSPDILIVEIDSIVYAKQLRIFSRIRQRLPKIVIIGCGPHPTAQPQHALDNGIDFVAIGEFEQSIVNLVRSDLSPSTPGIYPNPRGPLVDIDTLPLPENDDIKRRDYCRLYGSEYREVEMWVTRGCPVMCNFCVVANVYYGRPNFRTRNLDNVIAEIRALQRDIPALEGIFFNEEAHTFNKKYLAQLCDRLIAEGLQNELKFNCMGNYDTLDHALLSKMKSAGYYKIRIGLESLDQDSMQVISHTGLKSNVGKLMEVLTACRELGIKVYGTLSVGTLGATYEKDVQTLDKVAELHRNHLLQEFSLSINTPMVGTPFYEHCERNGWLTRSEMDYDGNYGAIVDLPHYSADQINRAFAYGTNVRTAINEANKASGVHYSSYDRQWCAPVYATSQREIGTGIVK